MNRRRAERGPLFALILTVRRLGYLVWRCDCLGEGLVGSREKGRPFFLWRRPGEEAHYHQEANGDQHTWNDDVLAAGEIEYGAAQRQGEIHAQPVQSRNAYDAA